MGNLFDELKRRNVFRVGAAYAVVSWIALQVLDVIAEPLNLPEWTASLVIVLLAIGLPISLLFAWAFELTPDGLKKSRDVEVDSSVSATTGRKLDFVIIGLLVLGLGYFVWESRFADDAPDGGIVVENQTADASIAVLPFVNMSSDPEQDYFSDGISEEILNVLAQIPDLHVTSRSSAFQFRGNDIHIPTVAETLGVAHVLEGSVRKSGLRVRITAQLIEASSDKHLWSETYDRELTDIFAVQDEISVAIVDALKETMGLSLSSASRAQQTASNEAHEAYLRGRHLVVQRTRPTIEGAVREFRRAVELDPDYALAHAELAIANGLLHRGQYGGMTWLESRSLGRPHAERALALDPNLAEAHAAAGFMVWDDGTLDEALRHFREALRINPNYSIVHTWTANMLINDLGRYAEGFEVRQTALRLDPLSIPAIGNYAGELMWRGRLEDADREIAKLASIAPAFHALVKSWGAETGGNWADGIFGSLDTLVIDPSEAWAINGLQVRFSWIGLHAEALAMRDKPRSNIFSLQGKPEEALEAARTFLAEEPESISRQTVLGLMLAAVGDHAGARPLLEAGWRQSGNRVTWVGLFGVDAAAALVAARRNGDKDADVEDLLAGLGDDVRRQREAGYVNPGIDYQEGLAAFLSGAREQGLVLIARAVDEGHFILPNEAYLQEFYDDPGFAPIRAVQEARIARERNKVLAVVCNDNPYAAVWQPEPGMCEAYSAAD